MARQNRTVKSYQAIYDAAQSNSSSGKASTANKPASSNTSSSSSSSSTSTISVKDYNALLQKLNNYALKSDLNNYVKSSDLSTTPDTSNYALKSDLTNYVKSDDIPDVTSIESDYIELVRKLIRYNIFNYEHDFRKDTIVTEFFPCAAEANSNYYKISNNIDIKVPIGSIDSQLFFTTIETEFINWFKTDYKNEQCNLSEINSELFEMWMTDDDTISALIYSGPPAGADFPVFKDAFNIFFKSKFIFLPDGNNLYDSKFNKYVTIDTYCFGVTQYFTYGRDFDIYMHIKPVLYTTENYPFYELEEDFKEFIQLLPHGYVIPELLFDYSSISELRNLTEYPIHYYNIELYNRKKDESGNILLGNIENNITKTVNNINFIYYGKILNDGFSGKITIEFPEEITLKDDVPNGNFKLLIDNETNKKVILEALDNNMLIQHQIIIALSASKVYIVKIDCTAKITPDKYYSTFIRIGKKRYTLTEPPIEFPDFVLNG